MRKQKWFAYAGTAALAATLSIGAAGTGYAQYQQRNNNNNNYRSDYRGGVDRHDRFDNRDRDVFRQWWDGHRNRPPVGFRDRDRLPYSWESRFRVGAFLDPDLRQRARPLPIDLYRRLTPPPPGYRYMVIGNHVVLVDNRYRLHDVFNFQLNF